MRRGEASLAAEGPLVARTGQHTGRSPNDKFVVKEPSSDEHVHWGTVNQPDRRGEVRRAAPRHDGLPAGQGALRPRRVGRHRSELQAADPRRQRVRLAQPVRAQHVPARERSGEAGASIGPSSRSSTRRTSRPTRPSTARAPTSSSSCTSASKLVLIGGTHYAGEIKKSIFTILNYTLPLQGVLSMHCSANIGAGGDTALFFGLSGTGKTTLSSDPQRRLIGDDEHGWSDTGVFNFEGGCYAKVIKLSRGGRAADLRDDAALRHDPRERRHRSRHAHARPRRRLADREHARLLSDRLHRQRRAVGPRRPPDERRDADRRRLRRAAADRAADARRRDVPLPLRLHRARRRHREGRHRAEGDLQHLLRRAVPAAQPERLRQDARREDRQAQGAGVAGEHRLDRRARTASAAA